MEPGFQRPHHMALPGLANSPASQHSPGRPQAFLPLPAGPSSGLQQAQEQPAPLYLCLCSGLSLPANISAREQEQGLGHTPVLSDE